MTKPYIKKRRQKKTAGGRRLEKFDENVSNIGVSIKNAQEPSTNYVVAKIAYTNTIK